MKDAPAVMTGTHMMIVKTFKIMRSDMILRTLIKGLSKSKIFILMFHAVINYLITYFRERPGQAVSVYQLEAFSVGINGVVIPPMCC